MCMQISKPVKTSWQRQIAQSNWLTSVGLAIASLRAATLTRPRPGPIASAAIGAPQHATRPEPTQALKVGHTLYSARAASPTLGPAWASTLHTGMPRDCPDSKPMIKAHVCAPSRPAQIESSQRPILLFMPHRGKQAAAPDQVQVDSPLRFDVDGAEVAVASRRSRSPSTTSSSQVASRHSKRLDRPFTSATRAASRVYGLRSSLCSGSIRTSSQCSATSTATT